LQNRQGLLSSTSGCRSSSGPCRERRRGGDSSGARLPAVDRGRLCCLAPGGCGCPGTLRRSALEAGANISQRRSKCALRQERSIPSGDGRAHCIALVRNYGPLGYRLLTRSATRNRFATVRTGRNSLSSGGRSVGGFMESGGSLGCGGGLPWCWGPLDARTRRGVHGRCSSSSLRPHPFQVAPFLCSVKGVCMLLNVLRSVCVDGVIRPFHVFSLNTDSMFHM
jgi:hypothetical protein